MRVSDPLSPTQIDRFGWIEKWLARGARPGPLGYTWLRESGFRTIVNLRSEASGRSSGHHSYDLEHIHIPVTNCCAPNQAQAIQWLDLCSCLYMRPIFVHCNAGEGRTSTFCALVRIAQGWPVAEAINEQIPFGFDPNGGSRNQAQFLREFAGSKLLRQREYALHLL